MKTITFSRLCHAIKFSYMLGGITLDRVESSNDLGVIIDSKMSYTGHIDVTVRSALVMLGFVKRLSYEFKDPYTQKTLYVSLVRLKLEYASCFGGFFNSAHWLTLAERRTNACVMFIFDILSSKVNSSGFLSLIRINALWYHTRASNFLRVDFHCTNYGVHEPFNGAV
jgi:hypothetical protein